MRIFVSSPGIAGQIYVIGLEKREIVMWSLIIIGLLIFFVILGMPVYLAMGITSIIYMLIHDMSLMIVPQVMGGAFREFVLLAIPLFMLSGKLMNTGGVTKRLFKFADDLVGHITGGLAQVNVLLSIIFAGMSGSALADTAGLGEIEIKGMVDKGFDSNFAAAITSASASIGPIIPPSIIMVIYGSAAGVSIAGLFLGGIIPGLLMGSGLMIINYFICKKRNYPKNESRPSIKHLSIAFANATPPMFTPIIILGGIVLGIFTPTEAALMASLYAFFLGFFMYRELTIKKTLRILLEVIKTTSSIMIIIAFASVFARILTQEGVPQQIGIVLTSITTDPLLMLLIINIFLLVLGCFMDVIATLIAVTPMLLPVIDTLPISRLHFGVILVLNLTIALNTPPMGASLFIASKIANTKIENTFRAMVPFLIVLIGVLFLISYFPGLVTYLPSILL